MLGVVTKWTVFAALTATLLPVQALAVAARLPLRRSLPVAYHRMLCALLGIRIREVGARAPGRPLLIVSNHVSYLDILVITALGSAVFVAKREVASWPLFGLLAKLQRTVFVDRDRRSRTGEANRAIAERLADGDPVVLFAEGTSNDGNAVLAFRSSLVGAAQAALTEGNASFVQPLALAYVGVDGLPAGRLLRPQLAWYGDMDLLPHLSGVMHRSAIDVTVTWGPPVPCDAATDRKALARSLEDTVRRLAAEALRS